MGRLQKIDSMVSKEGTGAVNLQSVPNPGLVKTRKASWRKRKGKPEVSFEWWVEISQENCKWERKGEEEIIGRGTVRVRAQVRKITASWELKHRIYTDEETVWHLHWKQGIRKALGVTYKF